MNLIAIGLGIIANKLASTRFRKMVLNNAYAKLLILVGFINWSDLPHLHHSLILLKIKLEIIKSFKRDKI